MTTDSKPLSPEARVILTSALVVGSWYIKAATITDAADLLRAGLVTADDDYEGPQVFPTDAARVLAPSLGLHPARFGGWTYHPELPTEEK